jgi:hypothetical protein
MAVANARNAACYAVQHLNAKKALEQIDKTAITSVMTIC